MRFWEEILGGHGFSRAVPPLESSPGEPALSEVERGRSRPPFRSSPGGAFELSPALQRWESRRRDLSPGGTTEFSRTQYCLRSPFRLFQTVPSRPDFGRARLQPCRTAPKLTRALAPEVTLSVANMFFGPTHLEQLSGILESGAGFRASELSGLSAGDQSSSGGNVY
jgi:hypothetical protein